MDVSVLYASRAEEFILGLVLEVVLHPIGHRHESRLLLSDTLTVLGASQPFRERGDGQANLPHEAPKPVRILEPDHLTKRTSQGVTLLALCSRCDDTYA